MRVALDELVAPLLEIEERHEFARTMLHLGALLAVQPRDETQELRARELLVDERAIGNEPELRLRRYRILRDIDPRDLHLAARRLQYAGDHAQRGRLARAVRPDEAEQLARRHVQVDRIDRREIPVF